MKNVIRGKLTRIYGIDIVICVHVNFIPDQINNEANIDQVVVLMLKFFYQMISNFN